jgi:hypothetical protein
MKYTFFLFLMISSCGFNQFNSKQKIDFNRYVPDEKNIANYKQLENYESYRPITCSDFSRNPFKTKRYKFDLDEQQ